GVSFNGRSDERLQDVVGPLTRYLPILVEEKSDPSFLQVINGLGGALRKAESWLESFVWEAIEEEDAERIDYRHFVFGFDYVAVPEIQCGPHLRLKFQDLSGGIDRLGLRLSCQDCDGELKL